MLRSLLGLFLDERMCAFLLRKARWRDGTHCPRCGSCRVKKNGSCRVFQRYYCKFCAGSFNDKTGTIFHYSHISLCDWFIAIYLFCMPWIGCSIRSISGQLAIPYRVCYGMLRALIERMASSSPPEEKLGNRVEVDELYLIAGMKGRGYHDEIVREMRRAPRRRGLKPWRGRGSFDKDEPMVMCYHERGGKTSFDVPIRYDSMAGLVCSRVDYGSTVYTDQLPAYSSLREYGFEHERVDHSSGEYVNGDAHTNNCECRANLLKLWLSKFMGVNKFNLELYVKTFQFLHNSRHLNVCQWSTATTSRIKSDHISIAPGRKQD